MTQVFAGIYPHRQGCAVPNFHIRLVNHENLYPNDDFCAYPRFLLGPSFHSRLKKMSQEYSIKAGEIWDPKLKLSTQALMKWIPDGVRVNGRPKANGVLDTINASMYQLTGSY